MNTFSVGESIRFGWETFTKRPWFFVGVTLLIMLASGITSTVIGMFGENGALAALGIVVNIALSTLIGMGVTAFYLKAHEAPESVESRELWHPNGFWRYLAATLLTGTLVVLGLILLVVPGIILMLMCLFVAYIVIDRGLGPIEAIKESRRITKGSRWNLLGLLLATIGINLLGILCLLVGLLVTIPVTSLAIVHAYRKLEHQASELTPTPSATLTV
jgi:uncharacterized membrane protein